MTPCAPYHMGGIYGMTAALDQEIGMQSGWLPVTQSSTGTGRTRLLLPMATAQQSIRGSLLALVFAALLSVVLLSLRAYLSTANVALLYLLPVLTGAAVGGLLPGILASLLCTLAFDLLFI